MVIIMGMFDNIKLKQQVMTTKVIGLILSWDILVLLSGWIEWSIDNPIFYSFVWLNAYLFITVTNVKKSGIGLFFAEIFNTIYNDVLDDRAKLNKAKESLGNAANFLSMEEIALVEKEKKHEKTVIDTVLEPILDSAN